MKGLLFFIFFCVFLLILGRNLSFLPQIKLADIKEERQNPEDLKKEIYDYILKQKGSFSIYYKDLISGDEFGIDENNVLTGASINKLFIVSYLYNLAGENKIDPEEKIILQAEDVQDYGTGSLRYMGVGETYSLKTLAKLSLKNSDNTAAHLLGIRLGMDNVQDFVNKLGLISTDLNNNKTTAKNVGRIFDLIYNRKITTPAYTLEILDFLKDTDFEDRLPIYLNKDIKVYHKTGDAVGMTHDGGVIDDGKNPFILSVMTNDMPDEEKAKKDIGEIAKIIYSDRNN